MPHGRLGEIMKNPYMVKCLDVSMIHITPEDAELLDKASNSINGYFMAPGLPTAYKYAYGYFVYTYIPDEFGWDVEEKEASDKAFKVHLDEFKRSGFSDGFLGLLTAARDFGCKYLQIDRDGTDYEDVPEFRWE